MGTATVARSWWGADTATTLPQRSTTPRPRWRPSFEQLEDRTVPALFGAPTPIVSLQNFSAANGHLNANLLFTLPNGTQQVVSTPATLSSIQRVRHGSMSCPVLNLTLGPVHLNVLGLVVDLQQLTLKVEAVPGRGQLLGNLLCSRGLRGQGLLSTVASELNTLIDASNRLSRLDTPDSPLGTGVPLNVAGLSSALTGAGITAGTATCPVLTLDVGPIDLNLLGLRVTVPTGVHLKVTAIPSSQPGGGLLGDLFCQLAKALDNPPAVTGILSGVNLANIVNSLANPLQGSAANTGPLALTGVGRGLLNRLRQESGSAASPRSCQVLSLNVGPINLNLLGLQVTTSPICLTITAQRGPGNLLGNLLCGPGASLSSLLTGLGNLLNGLGAAPAGLGDTTARGGLIDSAVLQRVLNELAANLSTTSNPMANCPILHLSLGPVNLNLLGLIVDLNNCSNGPVTVDVTAIPGPGNLLGNLLCDLTNLAATTP